MVLRVEPQGACPACGKPRVRRSGRQLLTCGDAACATELRARHVRGNVYGNHGGGPTASEAAKYSAVHVRARRALRGMPCAMADATCKGRLEVALHPDAPIGLCRADPDDPQGRVYFFGLPVTDGYRLLCRSHHGREGGNQAAYKRGYEDGRAEAEATTDRILRAFAIATVDPDISAEAGDRIRRAFGRALRDHLDKEAPCTTT